MTTGGDPRRGRRIVITIFVALLAIELLMRLAAVYSQGWFGLLDRWHRLVLTVALLERCLAGVIWARVTMAILLAIGSVLTVASRARIGDTTDLIAACVAAALFGFAAYLMGFSPSVRAFQRQAREGAGGRQRQPPLADPG